MKVFKYLLQLYNISYSELGNELGVTKQNIGLWVEKRNIPKKYMSRLVIKFMLPSYLFNLDLEADDKLKGQLIIRKQLNEEHKRLYNSSIFLQGS